LLAVDVVAGPADDDPEFDMGVEFDVELPPPSDEEDAAAAGLSEPPLDSAELAADFEPPLPA